MVVMSDGDIPPLARDSVTSWGTCRGNHALMRLMHSGDKFSQSRRIPRSKRNLVFGLLEWVRRNEREGERLVASGFGLDMNMS